MTPVEEFRLLAGDPTIDQDLIKLYLKRAEDMILGFCNTNRMNNAMKNAKVDLAVFLYNKQGLEGVRNYNEGGLSYSYESGIPSHIRETLKPYRLGSVLPL